MNNTTTESLAWSPDESQVVMLDYTVKFIIVLVITVLVYVCNIIVMVVLSCSSTIPYHQKYLMCSLCCTDLSMALLLTLSLVTSSYDRWIFGDQMCQIATLVLYIVIDVTFLTLAAMVLDKYLLVRYPMKHQRLVSKRAVIMCILSIWCFSMVCLTIQHTVWQYAYIYNSVVFSCVSGVTRIEDAQVVTMYSFFTSQLPALVPTIVFNIKIYLISTRHHNRVTDFDQGKRTAKVNAKGLRTIMIASGFSMLSSAPSFVFTIMSLFMTIPRPSPVVRFLLYYFVVSNSFTNCIIYTTTYSEYQKSQRKVWKKMKAFCVQCRQKTP